MKATTIFAPKVLSLMPTWQCTAACSDCGTFSTPRNRTRLDLQDLLTAITRAHEASFKVVVFTGGEATLRWKDLLSAIEHATSLGLSTRLVTNAWWARRPEQAAAKIGMLVSAGLKEINFSTGDEHAKFVPIGSIVNAILASLDVGLVPLVMIEVRSGARLVKSTLTENPSLRARAQEWLDSDPISESPWMPMDLGARGDYPPNHYVTRENLGQRSGCESLFNTHTLQADGRIAICCGLGIRQISELQIESFERGATSFVEIERKAEAHLVRLLVKRFGPERLLAKLAQLDPTIQWEGMHAHQCQACSRVFQDPAVRRTITAFEGHLFSELATALATDKIAEHEFSRACDGSPLAASAAGVPLEAAA